MSSSICLKKRERNAIEDSFQTVKRQKLDLHQDLKIIQNHNNTESAFKSSFHESIHQHKGKVFELSQISSKSDINLIEKEVVGKIQLDILNHLIKSGSIDKEFGSVLTVHSQDVKNMDCSQHQELDLKWLSYSGIHDYKDSTGKHSLRFCVSEDKGLSILYKTEKGDYARPSQIDIKSKEILKSIKTVHDAVEFIRENKVEIF